MAREGEGEEAAAEHPDGNALSAYLAMLAGERRVSPHTLSNYRRDLLRLLALAEGCPLGELSSHDIRRFAGMLHGAGLGGRSIARALSAWRGFYRWLGATGGVSSNPVDGIRAPRSPRRLPQVLSVDEAFQLLDGEMAPGDERLALRDRAMFELFYSSGLRLAELQSLDLDALVHIRNGEVRVFGKRRKERIVPVGGKARAALEAWVARREELARPGETALFVGQRGARIAHRVIQQRLQQWALAAGLSRGVHPHMLRHSFASHMLQGSGDLRAVQEMLGHASIASTQVYTHLDFRHLAAVYDAAHPRAKKR